MWLHGKLARSEKRDAEKKRKEIVKVEPLYFTQFMIPSNVMLKDFYDFWLHFLYLVLSSSVKYSQRNEA